MTSVAFIGGDGSGKSTIIDRLVEHQELPFRRIYMGANIESSNYALPWSRLALKIKLRRIAKQAAEEGIDDPSFISTHHMSHRQRSSSLMRTVARLANRLLEGFYRYGVALVFRQRGFTVLFDRHFAFDTFVSDGVWSEMDLVDRANLVYYRIVRRVFPEPDIVLFLQADPAVMVERKQEATVEYLAERNDYWTDLGKTFNNFVVIDANKPVDVVYDSVLSTIRSNMRGVRL